MVGGVAIGIPNVRIGSAAVPVCVSVGVDPAAMDVAATEIRGSL